ncbi:hypothetical protein RHGRI_031932 [Rhododendron griersonianum]|uniref:TRF2/HOY1 PH-like domain-containing protein n=1 Tax=Rhododendron griersonianum TaxID=479676 RepID=A0AAV6IFL2_9ERIC|nr:hypothetical protein RHGRI_031932 [Rhododendron griersonianum]KAG5525440.1 hypothetical protein RHGRI_031932 [Rhododendron griersonianum]
MADSGFQGSDLKRTRLSLDSNQQGGNLNSSGESSPLGLRLSKTPSFVNLVEMKLTQARTSPDQTHNAASACNTSRANKDDFETEKLKASNFPASLLKIGSWERISRYEGDLVAKCYYAKKKIVWEVLDGALKSKIEVQWSDIEAIRATIVDDQPGILEIELNQPPQFFRETNPQPRKHTLWHPASDFTGGQAPTFRRHYVRFPPGTLDKHYEKLLQCDHRLLELSRRPFPQLGSPYFYSNLFSGTDISFIRAPQSQVPCHGMQYSFTHMRQGQAVEIVDSYSPMSVMDFPQTTDNVNSYTFENPRAAHWGCEGNNGENLFTGKDYIQEMQPYISAAPHHEGVFSYHVPAYWGEAAGNRGSSSLIFSDIENHLLGESLVSYSDEGRRPSMVRPMCSVLEPREVSNFSQNIGADHVAYGQATFVHDMGINERLDMDNAIPYVQPNCCLPPQVFGGTSTMSHLPTENNPYGFSNPTTGDCEDVDASHKVWQ